MKRKEKTNEELLKEIAKLKQEIHGLKTSYTKDKQSEKILGESEEKYRTALNSIGDAVITVDKNENITHMNTMAEHLTAWNLTDALGKPLDQVFATVNEETGEKVESPVNKVLRFGKIFSLDSHTLLVTKEGKEIPIADSSAPIKNNKGEILGVVLIFRDQTKERTYNRRIQENEEKYRTVFQTSPDAISISRIDGLYEDINESFTRITGFTREEVIGKHTYEMNIWAHNEDRKKFVNALKEKGFVSNLESQFRCKDGRLLTALLSAGLITVNHVSYILSTTRDITERKRAEEQVNKLSAAVTQSPSVIVITDLKGNMEYVNPKFTALTGYSMDEAIGQKARILKSGRLTEAFYKELWNTIKAGKVWHGEFQNKKKNGELFWELASVSPIFNKEGEIINYIKVAKDITDQKLAEEALLESEMSYRGLFNKVSDAIYIQDRNGRFLDVNQGAVEMYGYPKEFFIGKTPDVISAPGKNDIQAIGKAIQKAFEGENQQFEFWGIRKNGEIFPKEVRLTKGIYFGQEVVIALSIDITERKHAEVIHEVLYNISNAAVTSSHLEELIEIIRLELGRLMDTTNFYIAFYDEKTGMLSSNTVKDEKDTFGSWPSSKSLTGYVIKHQQSLLARDAEKLKLKKAGEIITVGTPSKVWLGVPLWLDNKVIGAVVVQSYDNPLAYGEKDKVLLELISNQISISIHRKKAEELLKKSEERFDYAMKASNDGLFDWNLVNNKVYYSARWKSMLGYKEDELPNDISVWESLCHQQEKEESLLKLRDAIEKNIEHYTVEFRMKHKSGRWVNILSRAQIIYNEEGKAIRVVGTHADLTEQKKAEKELRTALENAKESDRLKSAFLANMSHEIRTPMNGILGFTRLLQEPALSGEEQQQYIHIIEKSGARMLNIINNIIDISKIEAGLMEVELSETNINEQIEYIYNFFKSEVEAKGMQLLVKTSLPAKAAVVKTDREKVYGILTNLVKNAIKYTKQGSIAFGYEIETVEENDHALILRFFVKDTGIGIPKERQKAIFERFVQADIEDKMAYQGAGLGLAISKAYVEMLGGKLWVESTEGKGSTFYFTLPYVVEPEHHVKESSLENKSAQLDKKLRILIVEDDQTSEQLLTIALKNFSKEFLNAKTGKEAIEICRNHPDIDLILMDIQMPVMNGYEATEKIRQFNKEVVIIAETAFALSGDREKALEAGCNDYISKPIDKKELLGLIEKWSGKLEVRN